MDSQPFTYLITAVSQVGFPIAITIYLLVRFEKKLEILTETILKLVDAINTQTSGEKNGK
jgi:hypothetical protein